MAKFIELTDYHSGKKMLANIDHIIAIQEPTYAFNGDDDKYGCMVYLSDFDCAIREKRSYDKLVAAIIVAGLEL